MNVLDDLLHDVRYAFRQLRRNTGLTLVVVLSLAFGVGANTAIFSAVDAVMLRRLPVKNPHELLMLDWSSKDFPEPFVETVEGGEPYTEGGGTGVFSYSTYARLRDFNQVFSSTFAFSGNNEEVNVGLDSSAESAILQGVSGNYFAALGIPPALGRAILPEDDNDSAPPVAVVSHRFWQRALGGDSSVVGRKIVVNGTPLSVIGVTGPGFYGLQPGTIPDLWIPLSLYISQNSQSGTTGSVGIFADSTATNLPLLKHPKTWWVRIVGRLKPEIPPARAASQLAGLFDESIALTGQSQVPEEQMPRLRVLSLERGLNNVRNRLSNPLLLLMATVGMVLLIACGNVAGLLLSRAAARRREVAIRLSLGVSRFRLIRQFLTESIVLAMMGGAAGLLVAGWANSILPRLLSANGSSINLDVYISAPVLAFTACVSLLTGLLFGLAPAIHASRADLSAAVRQGASGTAPGSRITSRKVLVCCQVALTLVIVTTAGLFARTLQKLENTDVGFNRDDLLLFTVRPGLNAYPENRVIAYYEELQARIKSLPQARSVTLSTRSPIGAGSGRSGMFIPGYSTSNDEIAMYRHQVGPGYFETFGIPIIRGRGIGEQDRQKAKRVVVINRKLAERYFTKDDPIGRRIVLGSGNDALDYEIAGVVSDVKYSELRAEVPPTVYFSYQQFRAIPNSMTFEVRSAGDAASLAGAIRQTAAAFDKDVPLVNVRTQADMIAGTLSLERAFATLTTFFGSLSLALACIGLYGTLAYAVSQRTKEVGIRMALGAPRRRIFAGVLGEVGVILGVGLAAGIPLTFAAAKLLRGRLFEVSPFDPSTTVAAVFAVVAATFLAGYLPARRASNVDPMVALRHE